MPDIILNDPIRKAKILLWIVAVVGLATITLPKVI